MYHITSILILGLCLASGASADGNCASALCRLAERSGSAAVRKFYESGSYSYAWLGHGGLGEPTSQAKALIARFETADSEGLNSADYGGQHWAERLAALQSAPSDATRSAFDLALTASALRYITDLHFGRASPGVFHTPAGNNEELADPAPFLRQRLVNATDPDAVLAELEPPYPGYRRTAQALQHYLSLKQQGSLPLLPVTAKTLEPGSPYPAAPKLAAILQRLGDLAVWTPSSAYDPALVDAVKHFQSRHGLAPDGRLGRATIAQLNTPLSHRIQQLSLTMERWRWIPPNFPGPPVVVNIPEFRLRAFNAAYQTELEMKVVVGSAYGGHKTPVFAADMTSVVFRPYWDVPLSIVRAELVPKVEKDPHYLAKNRYEAVNAHGQSVGADTPERAIRAQVLSGELRIRQLPGRDNALGLVKFLLPNPHDVYLHATPATELFSKTRRDFSHGCIRLEKPADLALWVLRNQQPPWTEESIEAAMNGDATLQVALRTPIPVLIVYATAVVPDTGEVLFLDDIYKQDAQLEKLLAASRPAL